MPAYFGQGTKLTVLDFNITPPIVKVLNISENEVCQKKKVTLVCVAKRFYPDHVTVSWVIDGEKTESVATDNAATRGDDKFYSITSRLSISYKSDWTKGKRFTCTVAFYNGNAYETYSDSITGPKVAGSEEYAEKYITSANTTMLAYGMFIAKSVVYGLFILVIIKRQCFK